ncbi:hypothetical protein F7725_019802 [Dissostichus mawsoni]|uniref:Disks large-associated protein 2 n=1 Tax=Dissostichus mawsoni TaxID=36200 RepID=A0A7J5YLQ2_DISMA|nr:hypothetical protein F7725_019802 [Dissostichus mawsoni]
MFANKPCPHHKVASFVSAIRMSAFETETQQMLDNEFYPEISKFPFSLKFRLPSSCSVDRAQPPPASCHILFYPLPLSCLVLVLSSCLCYAVVSYPPSYKKTPPPVPPRTTTKPLISVTAQSSTESTQDAYQEGRHPQGGLWTTDSLGRPIYSSMGSMDSLDSTKAVTMAMESAAGKRHASLGSHTSVQTCDKAVLVSKAEEYLKTPRSSIGIQVETATDSETESKGLPQFHSIGIQVEDHKRQGRFKRSNSVTTAVQADMELEGFPSMEDKGLQFGGGFGRHSEPSTPTQYGAIRTVRTQGLFSYREDYRPSSGHSSPQPEPWLVQPSLESTETGRVSPLRRDGSWFMQLLHNETKRLEGWCKEMEREAEEHDLTEESECPDSILGKAGAAFLLSDVNAFIIFAKNPRKIRSAVGSAQLLMSQKFQQFYWLCQQNLDPSAMPRPTSQDLAGFWDLLQLSIDDVTAKFDELQLIKSNGWQLVESPEKQVQLGFKHMIITATIKGPRWHHAGTLSGPSGPPATGSAQTPHGRQTSSFFQTELSHREGRQHRDLHPRGPDTALRSTDSPLAPVVHFHPTPARGVTSSLLSPSVTARPLSHHPSPFSWLSLLKLH